MEVKLADLNNCFNKAFDANVTLTTDTVRDDIGEWDSINHLNLIVELEDHYKVSFSKDEIQDMFSVAKIIEVLGKK